MSRLNKQQMRQIAVKIARDMLAADVDYQTVEWTLLNDDAIAPLLADKEGDELYDYVSNIIAFAEQSVGGCE